MPIRVAALTAAALLGFAGNSILCRAALRGGLIDPAAFTAIRLGAGAVVLSLVARASPWKRRDLPSALALFAYALPFSLAYLKLDAGTGALVLFGAVQFSMLAWSLVRGDRPGAPVWLGGALAFGGLVALVLPGLSAPPLPYAALMAAAGVAWAVYSLRGRGATEPIAANASNFTFACVPAALAVPLESLHTSTHGALLAVASGAITSGLGYSLWYAVLPRLSRAKAAVVQLCVPPLAAVLGVVLFEEQTSMRLAICGAVILGGVALATATAARPSRR
ncbi:MAG: EamA family transporter [Myxococcaceae bacterium]